MKLVRYHEAAETELLDAVGYLELQKRALGKRFLSEIRRAETLMAQFPEASQEIRPGIRKYVLRKFRYALIYALENDGLVILAVAHASRRPGYWVDRVPIEDTQ